MSDHHEELLTGLVEIRDHVHDLVEQVTEHARILTVVQQTVDELVVAVKDEHLADQSIIAVLKDIASQTGIVVDSRRQRDLLN